MKKIAILVVLCNLLIMSGLCAPLFAQNVQDDWTYDENILPGAAALNEYLPLLKDKRVCLLSNQTGIIPSATGGCCEPKYIHVVDALVSSGVDVVCLMSPEHGFRGTADAGEHVNSAVDEQTGIPVRSLYGAKISDDELMSGFDVLLFDLQDVGVRYYTYYITMIKMMARCAKYNIPFILLDRPNPVGFYTDGPLLDKKYKSGVGGLPIPIVYGMTIGELALMANGEGWLEFNDSVRRGQNKWLPNKELRCNLTVIKCRNYTHASHYKLPVKPSPNLPNMRSVYLYPSTCYFEATDVSLGRGTEAPFQIYGSPLMEGKTSITGEKFAFSFTPQSVSGAKNPPLLGVECYGRDLRKDLTLSEINARGINLEYVIDAYRGCGEQGDEFFKNNFEKEIGQGWVRRMIIKGKGAAQIKARWARDVARFKSARRPYLLYD